MDQVVHPVWMECLDRTEYPVFRDSGVNGVILADRF